MSDEQGPHRFDGWESEVVGTKRETYIEDERPQGWYWIDNLIVDDYAPHIGPTAVLVYNVLARFANKDSRECFPSYATIGKRAGVNRSTAIRAVAKLVEFKLISVRQRDHFGSHESNVFKLLKVRPLPDTEGGSSVPLPSGTSATQTILT